MGMIGSSPTSLLTFLLTKYFMVVDNFFLKDYSYSTTAVYSVPFY
jgi:hypothetical protein